MVKRIMLVLMISTMGCSLVTVGPVTPAQPTATEAPVTPQPVTGSVMLIQLEQGEIGCGDGIAPVQVTLPADTLDARLEALFARREQIEESGLYNALYQSDLTVQSVQMEGGAVTVALSGQLLLGGACDAPRAQAQLEKTVHQATGADEIIILINGQPLADVLSAEG